MASSGAQAGARTGGSVSFLGLTMVFLGLQLFGVIDWPWYWLLAPLWLPIAVGIGFLIGAWTFAVVVYLVALTVFAALSLIPGVRKRRKPTLRRRGQIYCITDASPPRRAPR